MDELSRLSKLLDTDQRHILEIFLSKIEQLVELLGEMNGGGSNALVRRKAAEFFATIKSDEDLEKITQNETEKPKIPANCETKLSRNDYAKLKKTLPAGHILRTVLAEHEMIMCFIGDLELVNHQVQKMTDFWTEMISLRNLTHIAGHFLAIQQHNEREEQVIFPAIERCGQAEPVRVLRTEHIEIENSIIELEELLGSAMIMNFSLFKDRLNMLTKLIKRLITRHLLKEEALLYLAVLQIINNDTVWKKMKQLCDDMGICFFHPELETDNKPDTKVDDEGK